VEIIKIYCTAEFPKSACKIVRLKQVGCHTNKMSHCCHTTIVFFESAEIRSAFLECAAALDSFTLSRSLIQGRSLCVCAALARSLAYSLSCNLSNTHTWSAMRYCMCVFFWCVSQWLAFAEQISPMPHDSRKVSLIRTAELICHFRAALCTRKGCT
jgi:hypothetical protein